jgi:type IV secretion system protein VirB11
MLRAIWTSPAYIVSVSHARFARDTSVRELLKPLQKYFTLEGVTEVVVNRPGQIMYEQGADWHTETVEGLSLQTLMSLVKAVATFSDQAINAENPILSAILPEGQRIQIIIPPAVEPDGISLSIRLPSKTIRTLKAYEDEGAFSDYVWAAPSHLASRESDLAPVDRELIAALRSRDLTTFLIEAVEARRNIAIVGDTGSGKTTLMKSVCQHIPKEERIVTIEDVREIELPNHPNRVHLLYSKGGQGVARITPADLIASNMRMRPDRVLLAELRGSESFDFLKLLTTGHSGSITSFHAESCALAFERYVLMAKEHADAAIFDAEGLKRLVTLTIDIVVHMRAKIVTLGDDRRGKIRYVSEVHFDPVAKLKERFGEAPVKLGALDHG